MKLSLFFLLIFLSILANAQIRQANTTGSEVMADVPYKIIKYDKQGNLNGIPVFIYIHDSNNFTYQNDLIDIAISLKNASENTFDPRLTFYDYPDSSFQKLISCKSVYDSYFDVQDFNSSLPIKDSITTINFIKDTNWWIPPIPLVQVTQTHWFFMFTIPPEKLSSYDDIIDIKVAFGLDYETDQYEYFRVFRYNDSIPELKNWYRGDTHFHGFFTQNMAEIGFPLEPSRVAAKNADLDWITITDHSCDYDNYGTSMYLNWQKLGDMVLTLNASDSDFVYIRSIEMSVDNSAGNVVHALVYPPYDDPFNLTYMGDGGGDLSGTNITVDDVLSILSQTGGFIYAAHPFSEGDKLSSLVNGSVWNLCHNEFPLNTFPAPSTGNVICNDTSNLSDMFSSDSVFVFKPNLAGGEILNLRNSIQTTDEAYDPWNANYTSVTPFSPLDSNDNLHFFKRYRQNMDVVSFLWKKSLQQKNNHPTLQNWKFFISAGSDAHGSFNYSNTDMTLELIGNINDNALGKLSTLAYCPNGMGNNGTEVLFALKNGHTVMSDGPIVTMKISSGTDEIIIGQDTVLSLYQVQHASLIIQQRTTGIYGDVNYLILNGYTQDSVYSTSIPVSSDSINLNLEDILLDIFGFLPESEYFILTAELETIKDFGSLADLYKIPVEKFHCYTNPIWLKIFNNSTIKNNHFENSYLKVFPNPGKEIFTLEFASDFSDITEINVCDLLMHYLRNIPYRIIRNNQIEIQLQEEYFPAGFYFIEVQTAKGRLLAKIIKQ
ncbi:MAG: hypothetical protein ABIJ97_12280 [Bacteroidota bacterium]